MLDQSYNLKNEKLLKIENAIYFDWKYLNDKLSHGWKNKSNGQRFKWLSELWISTLITILTTSNSWCPSFSVLLTSRTDSVLLTSRVDSVLLTSRVDLIRLTTYWSILLELNLALLALAALRMLWRVIGWNRTITIN